MVSHELTRLIFLGYWGYICNQTKLGYVLIIKDLGELGLSSEIAVKRNFLNLYGIGW